MTRLILPSPYGTNRAGRTMPSAYGRMALDAVPEPLAQAVGRRDARDDDGDLIARIMAAMRASNDFDDTTLAAIECELGGTSIATGEATAADALHRAIKKGRQRLAGQDAASSSAFDKRFQIATG